MADYANYGTNYIKTRNRGRQNPQRVTLSPHQNAFCGSNAVAKNVHPCPHYSLPCLALKIETLSS